MKFTRAQIADVLIIEPAVCRDHRGFFFESYNEKALRKTGVSIRFCQDNHVCSTRGVLRGLHYQIAPQAQAKLIRVIRGSIFDVAVDIRKESPTFGQNVSFTMTAEDKKTLYIPEGFAHGYLALEENTEVLYKVSDFYAPSLERGILWNDPSLNIKWPNLGMEYKISERDKKLPHFKSLVAI